MGGSARTPLLRYRNRDVAAEDVAYLQRVAGDPSASRSDASRMICETWDWRQANGEFSERGCRDLLLHLQRRGLISLPDRPQPARQAAGRRLPLLAPELIPLAGLDVRDPHVKLTNLSIRPINRDERLGWRLYMGRYHYLGDRPIVGEQILYAAFLDDELVALLGWGAAAFRAPLREAYVGWDESTKRSRLHLVANNVRFLVLPWVHVRHLASKVLALNLRRLSADWQRAWNHPVHLAETFVDTTRFRGTCYRAANWICLGHTAGRSKRGNAYLHGGVPKALFVYRLHRLACERLRGERS